MELKQPKTIISGQEVRDRILAGVGKTAEIVGATLGSKGQNVAYEKNWGTPNVLHDGVSIAKQIVLEDPYENMAAQLVITAAEKTNNIAGDGTTTATILTYAIVQEALQSKVNPQIIRKGIDKAVAAVVAELKRMAKPVKAFDELKQVATISAADAEMGELIATAIQKVGEDGVVTVQTGRGSTTEIEYKEGMEFERGLLSQYLRTYNDKLIAEFVTEKETDLPYVVAVNEKLDAQKLVDLVTVLYTTDGQGKLLLIADDFDIEALNTIIVNKMQGTKRIIPVKSPEFGDHRTALLSDIAILTGGQLLGGPTGLALAQAKYESFGRAEKIIQTVEQTIIIGGKGKKDAIEGQIKTIRKLAEEAKSDSERDKAEKRIGKLTGGVAVILVGAYSETEMQERKERVFDAQNATKAAISEGILPGGGVALLRARRAIDTLVFSDQTLTEGLLDGKKIDGRAAEKVGADIVKSALLYPIKTLVKNAGVEKPDYIVGKIEENPNPSYGYNVDTEQYVDLYKEGIIDPLKVVRTALLQAASVAIMLITTKHMLAFMRETQKKSENQPDGIGRFLD